MTHPTVVSSAALEKLKGFDSCTISNAIERLNVRVRNEGFLSGVARCRFPNLPPMVGCAATARIRTASPPINPRCYYDRMDRWNYLASLPEPRVMVLQDAEHQPELGAFVGEIHAAIGRALNCVGCVTNGAVRDLPAVEAMGFQMFARRTSVSHAYAHITEFGEPVEIDSLKISSGDLLHGDRHGVTTIPQSIDTVERLRSLRARDFAWKNEAMRRAINDRWLRGQHFLSPAKPSGHHKKSFSTASIASQIQETASDILHQERELIEFCQSPSSTLGELSKRIQKMNPNCDLPWRERFRSR